MPPDGPTTSAGLGSPRARVHLMKLESTLHCHVFELNFFDGGEIFELNFFDGGEIFYLLIFLTVVNYLRKYYQLW